jgi:predicted DNA-binding transcriptional regulator YafY
MNRFDRALGILLLLRGGKRISATTLAERFEVSVRTIYRDVDTLSALGAPLTAETGRNGGFQLLEGFFLPPVMFSVGEGLSLLLALTMFSGLEARPFSADLSTGEEKLIAALPPDLRSVLADVRSVVGFEQTAADAFHTEPVPGQARSLTPDVEGGIVETFLLAVLNRHIISLHYRSPYRERDEQLSVSPLGAFWDRDRWYLVGRKSGDAATPRLWRADRVLDIKTQTRPSDPEPDFDVRNLLGRNWLDKAMADWSDQSMVRIEMTINQANRLRRDWYYGHASFREIDVDRVEMTFGQDDRTAVFELIRWLGLGSELIEPVKWRELLCQELVSMQSSYSDSKNELR